MTEPSTKTTYKILLLGDSSVGKTCFLMRFTDNTFQDVHMSTIGLDYRLKEMKNSDGETINVQIWDTAGQERFRSITKNYYRGAHGILILFDVTSARSFDNMRNWVTQVKENSSNAVTIYVVGTKIDLGDQRCVSKETGEMLSKEMGLKYFETSAKENINVLETFNELVADIDIKCKEKVKKKGNAKLNSKSNRKCC